MDIRNLLMLFCISLFFYQCTPKVAETVVDPKPTEPAVTQTAEEELSPCKSWVGSKDREEAMTAHVLYRDQIKLKNFKEAFELWQVAFELAPAADGKRNYHFTDGIRIYEHFYKEATTDEEKKKNLDKVMELYDKLGECYGEMGYVYGKKGFDYFYTYPTLISDMEKFELFKKSIDIDGEKANYFILNPFTALLVNLLVEEKITVEEGQKYAGKIKAALAYGLENCEGTKGCEPWNIVNEYTPQRLEQLEGIKNFYDCDYFKDKYYAEFEADPTNCEVISTTRGRLKWAGCADSDPKVMAVKTANDTHCRVLVQVEDGPLRKAKNALDQGDYSNAISFYEEFVNGTDDGEKKAKFNLRIAKIYYVHLKKYSQARQYARKALETRPNWGDPYILIGTLYASSGPLCGPGRGWDSQVVCWPAIDKWQKAKSVDPSVAAQANKLINRYSQYMPEQQDGFMRSISAGSSYKVPCWIQETTKVRWKK